MNLDAADLTHLDDRPAGRPVPARPRRTGVVAVFRLIRLGSLLVLGVFWVVMGFLSPYFFTTANFSNMLQAAAIPAILALGQLLVILTGGIDLSAGAAYVLVGVVGVKFA